MKTSKKNIIVVVLVCFAFSCSKSDDTPANPVAIKCTNSTILDALLSGKQMYILAKVRTTEVLLNLKDKRGKARAFGTGINPVLYEWDIQIAAVTNTEVKLQAGNITGIQGNFVAGVYLPDSFFFKDDNCKISGETNDGQLAYNSPINYEDITNSKDLSIILKKYLW